MRLKIRIEEFYYNVINGISAWRRWAIPMWGDRDWDGAYLYRLNRLKLEHMVKLFERNKRYVGWENDVKWMKICIELFKKLEDDFYSMEPHDYVDSKFFFTDDSDIKGTKMLNIETLEDNSLDYILKYKTWHKRAKKHLMSDKMKNFAGEIDNEFTSIIMGDLRQNKARELVFKIMERNIEGWWD